MSRFALPVMVQHLLRQLMLALGRKCIHQDAESPQLRRDVHAEVMLGHATLGSVCFLESSVLLRLQPLEQICLTRRDIPPKLQFLQLLHHIS